MQLHAPSRPPLDLSRPAIMGVLNLTPDSFSDGGVYGDDAKVAVDAGLTMARQGASIIDVGGESTRPGAKRISVEQQQRRVLTVIERLRGALDERGESGVWISIDTTASEVARRALERGASLINDVSAGREDASMFALAASAGVPCILMHMLGEPATMQQSPTYDPAKGGVLGQVRGFLKDRAHLAEQAGVRSTQLVLDPGIGFGKTLEHNLTLMRALPQLVELGYPVMLGASRKRLIATLSPQTQTQAGAAGRLGGSIALTTWAVHAGVQLHRVHDVQAQRQAVDLAAALGVGDQGSVACPVGDD